MKLKLGKTAAGKPVEMDIHRLIDTRLLVTGSSGSGKSWLLRLICEQAASHVQTIILDREAEFSTLREKHDMVLVGAGGEIATDVRSAELLCRKLMELEVSADIDLYELRAAERPEFVRRFSEALINMPKKLWRPLLVIVDEAQVFCPESSQRGASSRASIIDLCSMGRKRGYCPILATQRLAKLSKDAGSELQNIVVGRTTQDVDRKRVIDMLGMEAKHRNELMDLQDGEFFAFGPAFNHNGVFRFRAGKVKTSHPRAGHRHEMEPPKPSRRIQAVLKDFQDLPEKAKAEAKTLADAQAEIRSLKIELRRAKATSNAEVDEKRLQQAIKKAAAEGARAGEQAAAALRRDLTKAQNVIKKVRHVTGVYSVDSVVGVDMGAGDDKSVVALFGRDGLVSVAESDTDESDLPAGELKVLKCVAQYPDGVSRKQISINTGYKRSSRDAYVSRLAKRDLVESRNGTVFATAAGVAALGTSYEPLPTGAELQEYWCNQLSGGELEIFRYLLEIYPDDSTRDEISENVEYKRSSRDAYIARLKSRMIIEVGAGYVKASDHLFE